MRGRESEKERVRERQSERNRREGSMGEREISISVEDEVCAWGRVTLISVSAD